MTKKENLLCLFPKYEKHPKQTQKLTEIAQNSKSTGILLLLFKTHIFKFKIK